MSEIVALIDHLGLEEHPEGGWFRRTWQHDVEARGRPLASSIDFLLPEGVSSRWHRIDAVELWHFQAGAPLTLSVSTDGTAVDDVVVGPDRAAGERSQAIVPADAWQSAASRGAYTLVGCTVIPAFVWEGFELAPPGWVPGVLEQGASGD